jgi:integrase/recombinase XerC
MDLLEQYLRALAVEKQYSAHTLKAYETDLRGFAQALAEGYGLDVLGQADDLRQVDHGAIRYWFAELDGARATLSRKLSAVRSFLRYHHRVGTLAANPSGRFKLPKKVKRLPTFVPEAALQKLLAAPTVLPNQAGDAPSTPEALFEAARNRAMIELFYSAGLRTAELQHLRLQDLDIQRRVVRVLGKGNRQRLVPYGEPAAQALTEYQNTAQALGLRLTNRLFVRPQGQPLYPMLVYRVVRGQLADVPGLAKRSPHVLRHTFATHLVDRGADLNAVSKLLGHQSLAATQVYLHNSIAKLKDVHKKAHPRA